MRDFSLCVKVRCVFRTLAAAVEMELDLQGICQGAWAVAEVGVVRRRCELRWWQWQG